MADINEFFRNYRATDTTFDLYARGRTRSRGLFLSRFFAFTALPDYSVSLFCADESKKGRLTTEKIRRRVEAVLRVVEEKSLKWAWLVIFTDSNLSPTIVSYAERYDRRELGIAIGSITSGQAVFSKNQLGQSIRKRLGFERLLERLGSGETN